MIPPSAPVRRPPTHLRRTALENPNTLLPILNAGFRRLNNALEPRLRVLEQEMKARTVRESMEEEDNQVEEPEELEKDANPAELLEMCRKLQAVAHHRSKGSEGESWDRLATFLPRVMRGLRKEDTKQRHQVTLHGFFHRKETIEAGPSRSSLTVPIL